MVLASVGIVVHAASYEIIDEPVTETCGNLVCDANETCASCAGDCEACQPPAEPPPAGGGSGGTGGGGGGGGGGGSGTGSEGLKATMREFAIEAAGINKPSTITALVSHGIPTPQSFVVELAIADSNKQVTFRTNEKIRNLPIGKAMKVIFRDKWVPTAAGDYNATLTLYSLDKAKKFDVKKMMIGIGGEILTVPQEPANRSPAIQQPAGGWIKKVQDQQQQAAQVAQPLSEDPTATYTATAAIFIAIAIGWFASSRI